MGNSNLEELLGVLSQRIFGNQAAIDVPQQRRRYFQWITSHDCDRHASSEVGEKRLDRMGVKLDE